MPRNIVTFSQCAGPGVARSHKQMGGLAGTIINAFFANKALTIAAFVGILIGLIVLQNPITWAVFGAGVLHALTEVKYWYYNERLLCIAERECAVGTVISEPTNASDGDRKINLLLAPFSQAEGVEVLHEHLDANEGMLRDPANFAPPFHAAPPNLPTSAERRADFAVLRTYLNQLAGTDPADADASSDIYNQVLVGLIDRLLRRTSPGGAPKNIFERFFRKTPALIPGSPLWNAMPVDFDPSVDWQAPNAQSPIRQFNRYAEDWQGLNPLFRFDNGKFVPYLHCEVEGNVVALLIDSAFAALTAWLATIVGLWAILGPWAPLVGLIFAIIVFLVSLVWVEVVEDGGIAAEPNIDWEDWEDDHEVPAAELLEQQGDVVVVYGSWIMDTEHHQYFEIHPVRAWYLIDSNGRLVDPPRPGAPNQQPPPPRFDPTTLTAERINEMCATIRRGEEEDLPDQIARPVATVLSWGAATGWSGATAPVD